MYNTYFSNQEWSESNGDVVKLITSRHELGKIEIFECIQEAHGVIVAYSITY
jgi:hypothetical protein